MDSCLWVSIPLRYAKNGRAHLGTASVKRFQFLLGTLKTRADLRAITPSGFVSIPLRYAKNEIELQQAREEIIVSIPLRYAKNGVLSLYEAKFGRFQFLLGTLKTPEQPGCRGSGRSFNSS